jgi:hypothetical protein
LADLDAICQGLAALLRTTLPANEGHVFAYFQDEPPTPCLQVASIESVTNTDFGDGMDIRVLVEAVVGKVSEIKAQKRLRELVSSDAVAEAVESDQTASGALFDRLDETGTLTEDVGAAADAVAYVSYRGDARLQRGQSSYLIGTFEIQVLT